MAKSAQAAGGNISGVPLADALSEREQEVARRVACGLLSKEIADQLGLSTRTVEKHRARILAKLGLHDTPTLVRWCMRNGLG